MVTKANNLGGLGITPGDMSESGGNEADRPATQVSWFEAARFVNWLNTSTGDLPAYQFDGVGVMQIWPSGEPSDPVELGVSVLFGPDHERAVAEGLEARN